MKYKKKIQIQGFIKFLIPGGGEFIKSVGKNFKNIMCKERQRGRNIIFPIILRLLGRISSWEEGKGKKILGKKIKIVTKWGGEEYQVTFYNPDQKRSNNEKLCYI